MRFIKIEYVQSSIDFSSLIGYCNIDEKPPDYSHFVSSKTLSGLFSIIVNRVAV